MTAKAEPGDTKDTAQGKRGGFFAIDRHTWHRVCGLEGINPATAFLVMACGTGPDNRTTSYSTNAIERYTPIARSRAKAAIGQLVKARTISVQSGGRAPRYKITTSASPQWIWLPNEIVTGAAGEAPALTLLHHSGDVMVLRLFVDLYGVQNLIEDGGISPWVIRQKFSRVEIGQHAEFTVLGFRAKSMVMWWGDLTEPHRRERTTRQKREEQNVGQDSSTDDFWPRLERLLALGLIRWVPHLFANASRDAEIIHPYGIGNSQSIEDDLGHMAHEAGLAALTDAQVDWALEHKYWLVPVLGHFRDAQMIGVLRMRYRTKSAMTATWLARNTERCEAFMGVYDRLIERDANRPFRAA